MTERKPDFADLLMLESVDRDIFRGLCHDGAPMRAFGGQVAAQAQVAAGRTVEPDRRMHSLHGYFLRPGRTDAPIVYLVERIRDGRSFTTRRVSAVQDGETIFSMSASFQRPRDADETHQREAPDVPEPETLRRWWGPIDEAPEYRPFLLIDIRSTTGVPGRAATPPIAAAPGPADGMPRQNVWVRVDQVLPDDPLLHVCALTYLSDLTLASTANLPYMALPGRLDIVSLDHAMWFHRPFRADDWLLFAQDSPSADSGRGLSRGMFFTRDGLLVASAIQEVGLFRR
ncbi:MULTISPECIES: acyl-CoA thioesterase II [Parafrankia]|uniref:Acyl-CoA thioesterase 2 n=1 Tax=Parafrankia soli TaxID=2599596 RepID=A0A1S1PY20_9ACTN|nr:MULTISPECIES: acyl-CoA thioesterase domain-containing protein [Parafrankia]OHV27578.1 acyl-CoA thioesterase II [Parafrankia soli]TCJ34758.1 acyl-CoA thioesterase II [Parafrankia sp. BMG5.11]CAI7979164.1 Acyl-CoA thioesterase 2 [Frankia sp. Hr75.2]SQD93719.1 Acyl-CoA thioesterase 2 [Parafrankia sp. Ea1.12]